MRVIDLEQIETVLESADLVPAIEAAFVAYSSGRAVVPPVGELLFENPSGEVHIKYGYLLGEEHYVVKIASGFYDNPSLGLPSGDGLMVLFEQRTGRPVAVLLDHARLTDVRTAVAGAIAARLLAPERVERIGIVGTGVQARLQLQHLADVSACRQVLVWGRREEACRAYRSDIESFGFEVAIASDLSEIGATCELIVTTTPAREPLIAAADVRAGTHITAVGSDTVGKQELEAELLGRADRIVADSRSQCRERGEIATALGAGLIAEDEVAELGELLAGTAVGRTRPEEITIADLTGLAVQDVQAARAVFDAVAADR